MGNAIKDLLRAKRSAGRREKYLKGLSQYLLMFARGRQSMSIAAVTGQVIEDWFASRNEAPSTRRSNLGRLSALFSFAVRRGWCFANPCLRVEPVRLDPSIPQVLTPWQAWVALRWTTRNQPRYLAYLVLVLIVGLRPDEAMQATWGDVRGDHVVVGGCQSKTRRRRVIDLGQTSKCWLNLARAVGSVLPVTPISRRRFIRRLRNRLTLKAWPQDLLRHTCGTYLLAQYNDAPKVALRMGNSPVMLLRHYRGLIDPSKIRRLVPAVQRCGERLLRRIDGRLDDGADQRVEIG